MIIFDKPLNVALDRHIKDHCGIQKQLGLLGTAGFLIGSRVGEDIHIAHIAICPLPETANDLTGDIRSRLIDSEWIADHGTRIVRMLPGGVEIVGLLWLADKKLSIEPRNMLIQALAMINKRANFTSSLQLFPSSNNMALVCIETPLGKPQGYIVDCTRKGAEGSQTRIAFNPLEWINVKSSAGFSLSMPIDDPATTTNFYKLFCSAVREWAQNFFTTETTLVGGRLRSGDEPLRSRERKGKGNPSSIWIDTFVTAGKHSIKPATSVMGSLCVADLKADVSVCAAVSSKATVQDAINAVKQHVIRTLCSRAEMHYECTEVVEDEPKDHASFHQLPRLTCVSLPTQPAIAFTDYLFEGDTKKDSQDSFKELLSLAVTEDCINDGYERHLAEGDLVRFSTLAEKQGKLQKSSVSSSSQSIAAVISNARKELPLNYIALLSVLIALLAIAVYLLMHSLGE